MNMCVTSQKCSDWSPNVHKSWECTRTSIHIKVQIWNVPQIWKLVQIQNLVQIWNMAHSFQSTTHIKIQVALHHTKWDSLTNSFHFFLRQLALDFTTQSPLMLFVFFTGLALVCSVSATRGWPARFLLTTKAYHLVSNWKNSQIRKLHKHEHTLAFPECNNILEILFGAQVPSTPYIYFCYLLGTF